MDFSQIQEIIRMVSKYKLSEIILKEGEFELVVRNQSSANEYSGVAPMMVQPQPQQQQVFAPPVASVAPPESNAPKTEPAAPINNEAANYLVIKSPMVGTFYRSSTPDKPPFIKIGDAVDAGQTVCIIEAMKLFNEIESDIKGKIVKVLVEDASPVEYEQPLFLVDPA
jgi:acetyl-CoA carboxylase biotin carboxyl carrier protein